MIASRANRQSGFIAVVLVLTLAVVTILGGTLLRTVLLRRAELRTAERRLQAEWLAESGLSRAIARLTETIDYPGETWEVPATEFGGRGAASIAIQVAPIPGKPAARRIRVRADYPKAEARRARETRELTIELTSKTNPTSPNDRKGDSPR